MPDGAAGGGDTECDTPMLLRAAVLDRIVKGEVSLVFRRWRKPTVRTGGSLRTALGVLRITEIAPVEESAVTDADARAAGYTSRSALLADLGSRTGQLYRIALEYGGTDPRIALRRQDALSEVDAEDLLHRLARLDARSPAGRWTHRVLAEIAANPRVAAQVLAQRLGCGKDWLKPQVRKLKNLGLTVSLPVGYELSPRGRAALQRLRAKSGGENG